MRIEWNNILDFKLEKNYSVMEEESSISKFMLVWPKELKLS